MKVVVMVTIVIMTRDDGDKCDNNDSIYDENRWWKNKRDINYSILLSLI